MTPVEPGRPNNAMMLDIETLGLGTNSYVTQIGVCVANLDTREYLIKPRNIWTQDDQPAGKIDFGTVSWWMQQDRKVAESVFDPKAERMPADHIFTLLKTMVDEYRCTVWGSPAMFDLPILTNFFGNRKPWKYNVERDMMTLYKLLDPTGAMAPPKNEMAHDGAADAQWQMEYLFTLAARLRLLDPKFFS
jgi:hypothetical protein